MSETLTQSEQKKSSNLPVIIDGISCLTVMGGAVASLITQQVALVTLPLSVMFTLQVFNRQKIEKELAAANQLAANVNLAELFRVEGELKYKIEENKGHTDKGLSQLRVDMNLNHAEVARVEGDLNYKHEENKGYLEQLQSKTPENLPERLQTLETMFNNLKEITDSVNLDETTATAEAYYNRGLNQEQLGNLNAAIADYTQAIDCSANHAWSYFRRGLAKMENGLKQAALIDLNSAAKYFFEEGDLENYQMAKDKAAEIHKPTSNEENLSYASPAKTKTAEPVSVDGLFGA